jgi:hypothetical protein
MAVTTTKAGTGAGAVLVICATLATLAAPAPAPSDSPTAFTLAPVSTPTGIAVLQMKDFTMPSQKWAFDDITNTSSPTVGVGVLKESLATLVDPGEFSCTGIFLPSDDGLIALQTAFSTGIANQFQVQLQPLGGQSTTGNIYEFNAYVQENPVPSNISAEKAVTVKISLKLDSIMTVAVGS